MSSILDVNGIKLGQEQNMHALTGCSVVICEKGATCGVDVRGGAPGTRETDLLNPLNLIDKVHAVVLSGGSAYGLECTCGVAKYLEEIGVGFDVGVTTVPIVVGVVLFDLAVGNPKIRPDIEMGYNAAKNANDKKVLQGNYGCGCGATVGKIRGNNSVMKSGVGTHSIKLDNGLVVSALVGVNAFGDVYENGHIIAGAIDENNKFLNTCEQMKKNYTAGDFSIQNTTIGVVVTNAKFDKSQCTKISQMAHNGYARSINPIHTMNDGDTIFTMATGEIDADVTLVGTLASEVVEKSVINAIKNSKGIQGILSYSDLI